MDERKQQGAVKAPSDLGSVGFSYLRKMPRSESRSGSFKLFGVQPIASIWLIALRVCIISIFSLKSNYLSIYTMHYMRSLCVA